MHQEVTKAVDTQIFFLYAITDTGNNYQAIKDISPAK
jgi:hypothetical protein